MFREILTVENNDAVVVHGVPKCWTCIRDWNAENSNVEESCMDEGVDSRWFRRQIWEETHQLKRLRPEVQNGEGMKMHKMQEGRRKPRSSQRPCSPQLHLTCFLPSHSFLPSLSLCWCGSYLSSVGVRAIESGSFLVWYFYNLDSSLQMTQGAIIWRFNQGWISCKCSHSDVGQCSEFSVSSLTESQSLASCW